MQNADQIFIALLKEAKDSLSDRWHTPLIESLHGTLTKRDVFNYYSDPRVRQEILKQIKNKPVIIHQKFEAAPVLRRLVGANIPIQITQDAGEINNPADYQYWIERRAIEFHPALEALTKQVFVDIDPAPGYDWDKTKTLTNKIYQLFEKHPEIYEPEIRFSGGTGFYITGTLNKDTPTSVARTIIKKLITPLERDDVTSGIAKPNQIRLDISTLKPTGSIRGAFSLNKDTGLVSIPVEHEHLSTFEKEHATINNVLGHKPKNARPFRI